MKITREQLKEIIREELKALQEKTINIEDGIKLHMTVKGGHPHLRIDGSRGYVELYGRPEIENFSRILRKNFRIV
tara:strand:+ start:674 stop:898 length:225 start_codon:yes stop_codon:yes gene_type:complete